ncbi:MAG: flippase-like domain-containing protein [Bacilli bacterium]|nr:flippase-like domain-containing protein [Bacilli bacterium]
MKNKKLNLLIIFLLTGIVLYIVLKDNFTEKIHYMLSFNIFFLLVSFLMMFIYWFLKGLVLYNCTRKFKSDYTKKKGIGLMITSQFFHSITPFASGGQPWQIYRLKKEGLTVGEGTIVAIQDFIAFQSALILLGIVAVISNQIFHIIPSDSHLLYLVIIGFTLNIIVIIGLFIIAFSKKWNKKIINGAVKLLSKIKIVKDREKMLQKAEEFIKNFHESAEILFQDKQNFFKIIGLNFVALVFQYSIPFFLMLGLGIHENLYYVLIASAYVMLIDSMMPTPGSTGGLEYGFMSFFSVFVKGAKLSALMIVWRMITYYFGLIMGSIVLGIDKESKA